jgi:hypothetical protein
MVKMLRRIASSSWSTLQDAGTGLPTDPDRVAVQSEPDSEDRLDHVVVQVTGSFSPR